jgi:hypothetical protein
MASNLDSDKLLLLLLLPSDVFRAGVLLENGGWSSSMEWERPKARVVGWAVDVAAAGDDARNETGVDAAAIPPKDAPAD